MNAYLNYFIESNIGLILFLAAYSLILKKETDFKIKRYFLLIGMMTSLVVPLFNTQYQVASIPTLSNVVPSHFLQDVVVTPGGYVAVSEHKTQSIEFYVQWVYILGVGFFCIRLLFQLLDLARTLRYPMTKKIGNLKIIEFAEEKPTFSFFNIIVIGGVDSLSDAEKQNIIHHESVHAQRLHSFDILFINLMTIVFWFNPLLRNYKNIFVQLHEFEADACTVENRDVNEYCSLLARVALESAGFKLANHFNSTLILKRIEMMKTIKRKTNPLKILVTLSVIPLVMFLVACQDQILGDEKTLSMVEQPAIPEGGTAAFYSYVSKKITYPSEARKKGIAGKVLVEFMINTDGTVDVTGISGIGLDCDLEAMQVIQTSPKWKPAMNNGIAVKQRMVLPINFKLAGQKTEEIQAPADAMNEIVVVGYGPVK